MAISNNEIHVLMHSCTPAYVMRHPNRAYFSQNGLAMANFES